MKSVVQNAMIKITQTERNKKFSHHRARKHKEMFVECNFFNQTRIHLRKPAGAITCIHLLCVGRGRLSDTLMMLIRS